MCTSACMYKRRGGREVRREERKQKGEGREVLYTLELGFQEVLSP